MHHHLVNFQIVSRAETELLVKQGSEQMLTFTITASASPNGNKQHPASKSVSRRRLLQTLPAIAAVTPAARPVKSEAVAEHATLQTQWPLFNGKRDFASVMEYGTKEYEKRMESRKRALFSMITPGSTVLDIGIGVAPNLRYIPNNCTVIGIEPNRYMWAYAKRHAQELNINLYLRDAYAEKLPVSDATVDFVVSTLTMCSVHSPQEVLDEIARVMKPGATFLFIEHVLAPTNEPVRRAAQLALNPLQRLAADGCNLNRDTERSISEQVSKGIFDRFRVEHFYADFGIPLESLNLVRNQICGYAYRTSVPVSKPQHIR